MNELSLDHLLTLERQGWDALCESTGSDFYGGLMTADALMVLVNGMTLNRSAVVSSLDGAPAWDSYEITDAQLVHIAADCAAVVYHSVANRDDEAFEALMSSTYVLVDGTPRLALYQQTAITH